MAITRIQYISSAGKGGYGHISNAIHYILNPAKTADGKYVGTSNLQCGNDPDAILQKMIETKAFYGKTDKRQAYHMYISFVPGEADEAMAAEITKKFVERYFGADYEAVWAVHNDRPHMHGHIIFNSVALSTGLKYRYEKGDWAKYIQPVVNDLCKEYGLSTIEFKNVDETEEELYARLDDKTLDETASQYTERGMTHEKWEAEKNGCLTGYEKLRQDVDEAILMADDYSQFLHVLYEKGYRIRQGKYLSLKPPWRDRPIRSYQLGKKCAVNLYTVDAILKRIQDNSLPDIREGRFPEIPESFPEPTKRELREIKNTYFTSYSKYGRKVPMTAERKRYVAKLYREGRLCALRNSSAYHKEALSRFYMLRREIEYANKYQISGSKQADERLAEISQMEKELYQARKALNSAEAAGEKEENEKKAIQKDLAVLRREKRILVGLKQDYFNEADEKGKEMAVDGRRKK